LDNGKIVVDETRNYMKVLKDAFTHNQIVAWVNNQCFLVILLN